MSIFGRQDPSKSWQLLRPPYSALGPLVSNLKKRGSGVHADLQGSGTQDSGSWARAEVSGSHFYNLRIWGGLPKIRDAC